MLPETIKKYLGSKAIQGPWAIEGCGESSFSGAVVIPALAEYATLFATLRSLAQNPPDVLSSFLVVVVVNHREDAEPFDKAENLATLGLLKDNYSSLATLNLGWVDAASPGLELPTKNGGVGLARKIGLDLVLTRLKYDGCRPILVCLDADTLVRPDYLPALVRHFGQDVSGGAVIPFRHQQADSPAGVRAIVRYELFLRSYVLGLSMARSPYAFHTVGSAMACRVSAYVKIGGMNNRSAGEDFYFLQQLSRTVGVDQVEGTVVYPSPRASRRVPFGTGRSVSRLIEGEEDVVLFYQSECFRVLGQWLAVVSDNPGMSNRAVWNMAEEISLHLAEYLDLILFKEVWEKLQRNNHEQAAFLSAFHGWFDGLKSMKLIHHLSAARFPRCEPELALPGLFNWAGLKMVSGMEQQLELLCRLQLGNEYDL